MLTLNYSHHQGPTRTRVWMFHSWMRVCVFDQGCPTEIRLVWLCVSSVLTLWQTGDPSKSTFTSRVLPCEDSARFGLCIFVFVATCRLLERSRSCSALTPAAPVSTFTQDSWVQGRPSEIWKVVSWKLNEVNQLLLVKLFISAVLSNRVQASEQSPAN